MLGDELHAFDAPAEAHHAPALVVHHVFFGKPGERRERQQYALVDFAAAAARRHGLLHLALQSDDAAPVTRRQPVAHLRCAPGEMLDVGLQALRIARAQRVEDLALRRDTAPRSRQICRACAQTRASLRAASVRSSSREVFSQRTV